MLVLFIFALFRPPTRVGGTRSICLTIGAQPRAARDRRFDFALRFWRLVGRSALLGRPPTSPFVFASFMSNRNALLTDAESGKASAMSGSRNTTFVPARYAS